MHCGAVIVIRRWCRNEAICVCEKDRIVRANVWGARAYMVGAVMIEWCQQGE